jgi:GT2 family glycosyltransferase
MASRLKEVAKRSPALRSFVGGVRRLVRPLHPDERLIRKVRAKKSARSASPFVYTEEPTLSVVVQSFNHRRNVSRIVERLRLTAADELIVCEDGSLDGSERAWREALQRPNDFVILSNDLHEIRTYNRAVSLARGAVVCVTQDDDIPPTDPAWVTDALELFEAFPQAAVIGCWQGWAFDYDHPGPNPILSHVGPGMNTAAIGGPEPINEIPSRDPQTNLPFSFVEAVCVGPLFFRRSVFQSLGGFDLELSRPGESGIWLDYDLCIRAWLSGHHVGVYAAPPFERNVGGQGTFMFGPSSRQANWVKNRALMQARYRDAIPGVRETIDGLNRGLASRSDAPGGASQPLSR